MMKMRKNTKQPSKTITLMSDFETTVFSGQTSTEVWAAACVEFNTENVHIFHSLEEWFNYLISLNCNIVTYFHNLKFDGEFILAYLLRTKTFQPAFSRGPTGISDGDFLPRHQMRSNTYSYSISNRGAWYRMTIKVGRYYIDIRDSLKLLPFSVRELGDSFQTKHKKLDMEYTGLRYAGCEITPEEQEYIKNDVLVVKEALEIMFAEGHRKTTIGGCCLAEYKKSEYLDEKESHWEQIFPNLYEIKMSDVLPQKIGDREMTEEEYENYFGVKNVGEYIRLSYRGGWCYLVDGKENKLYHNGTTADVNSLYPSMMSSESGNYYPYGLPTFWQGNFIPVAIENYPSMYYYFVRIRTEFNIKDGKLPCIQIKHSPYYDSTKWLTTSDIFSRVTKDWHNTIIDPLTGEIKTTAVTLTLTCTDYKLILEHYDLYNTEILDGCYFSVKKGLFDSYIEKYKKIKMESTGAKRSLAKLFLNNLYGQMATNTDSSFKWATLDEDESVKFINVPQYKKKPGYIPVGSAITSYARNFTIRAAQANYHGVNEHGFIYADTDSIHCDLPADKITGITPHDNAFCCWKLESSWDVALFVRQKTYLEHVVAENLIPVQQLKKPKKPYFSVRCAGMPEKCKEIMLEAMKKKTQKMIKYNIPIKINGKEVKYKDWALENFGEIGVKYLSKNYLNLTDFKVGLVIPTGKLRPTHIKGGVLLVDIPYSMRRKILC